MGLATAFVALALLCLAAGEQGVDVLQPAFRLASTRPVDGSEQITETGQKSDKSITRHKRRRPEPEDTGGHSFKIRRHPGCCELAEPASDRRSEGRRGQKCLAGRGHEDGSLGRTSARARRTTHLRLAIRPSGPRNGDWARRETRRS